MRFVSPRIAISALVAVNLFGDFWIIPAGYLIGEYVPIEGEAEWIVRALASSVGFAFAGGLLAQIVLLGLWAAWGAEPLLVRWPRAVFLLTLGLFLFFMGSRMVEDKYLFGRSDDAVLLRISAMMVGVIFVGSQLIAWVWLESSGRRLASRNESEASSGLAPSQFSLARLAIWTAGVAVLLGIGRLLPPSLIDGGKQFWPETLRAIGYGAVAGACSGIPMILACVPISRRFMDVLMTRRRALLSSVVYLALLSLGEVMLLGLLMACIGGVSVSEASNILAAALAVYGVLFTFNIGILTELALAFSLVRWCGFNFVKKRLSI